MALLLRLIISSPSVVNETVSSVHFAYVGSGYSLAFVSQSPVWITQVSHSYISPGAQCCRFVQARSPLWTWPLSTVLMHITPKSHLLVPLTAVLSTKPSKNTSIISKVFAHFLPTSHCLYFSDVILRTQQWKNTLNEGIK